MHLMTTPERDERGSGELPDRDFPGFLVLVVKRPYKKKR
jgi:hypothetical protein